MQALVVPKNRRPKFELHLRILDLNNVPYVSGRSYVKWHLPSAAKADGEHDGRTQKTSIKDHKVLYNYETIIPIRMTIDKTGQLQDTPLDFRVIHEVSHTEKILLGTLSLNIARYVDASEQGVEEEGVVRRYLMQDSKINSTIKIGIYLRQLDGDRGFTAPELTVAPVFSGIAGLVVGEVEDNDGVKAAGTIPAVNSKSQVASDELRELYRQTIAANWTCLPGELSADKVVEDIFSGGDGWLSKPPASGNASDTRGREDDGHANHNHSRSKNGRSSFFPKKRQDSKRHSKEDLRHERPTGVQGRAGFEHQGNRMGAEVESGMARATNEFDELEIRDNLRSWKLPV